jgi:hypothetical protein
MGIGLIFLPNHTILCSLYCLHQLVLNFSLTCLWNIITFQLNKLPFSWLSSLCQNYANLCCILDLLLGMAWYSQTIFSIQLSVFFPKNKLCEPGLKFTDFRIPRFCLNSTNQIFTPNWFLVTHCLR